MRKLLKIFLFTLVFSALLPAEKLSVVVLNFKTTGIEEAIGVAVSEMFRVHLFTGNKEYRIIEREDLNKILKEQALTMSGAVSGDEEKKIGKVIAADYLIIGSITKLGKKYLVQAKMVDSATSEIKNTAVKEVESLDALPGAAKNLAYFMLGLTAAAEAKEEVKPVKPRVEELVYQSYYSDSGGITKGGKIILKIEGDMITGTSVESYGNADMRGSINGDKIVGYYKASYGHGNFEFTISADRRTLIGKYYQISNGAYGVWNGEILE